MKIPPAPEGMQNGVATFFFCEFSSELSKGGGELFFIFQPATCNECGCFDREIKEKTWKIVCSLVFCSFPKIPPDQTLKTRVKSSPCAFHIWRAFSDEYYCNLCEFYFYLTWMLFFRLFPSKKAPKMYVYYHNFTNCSPFACVCVAN